ncbi:MAG: hypothetical protein KDK03_05035 [Rhodobacteraceae bacterium]|nr:hypothetical protein [Paracoccaceae bacterium]
MDQRPNERRLRLALAWALDTCPVAKSIIAMAPGPLAYGQLMQRLFAVEGDRSVSVALRDERLTIRFRVGTTSIEWKGGIPATEAELTGEDAA